MGDKELQVRFKAVKKSGDKLLDSSENWALAADAVWWAPLPGNALGRVGQESGLITEYANACREINEELREGSRTLGMAAAALWKVSKAYKDADDEARDRVLKARGFDTKKVPRDYW